MPSFRPIAIALMLAVTLASCNRDPNKAKKKYLESGNAYFDHGQYKYAVIQYSNATKIDPKFGPAYYKLGVVYLKEKPAQVALALKMYRVAVELLKDDPGYQEEYKESIVQAAELNLVFLPTDKQAMEDVANYCEILLAKDPNSFEAFRLSGDLNLVRSKQQIELTNTQANKLRDIAMVNYRRAESIKPNDPSVALQIGTILAAENQPQQAEPYFRKVIDGDKSSPLGYKSMYGLYMSQGKTADAENILKEAIRDNPKTYEYLVNLAHHYGRMGRRDDMLNVLEQIKSHSKDFAAVYQVVGSFYLRIGDAESALREFREGVVKDSKNKANYEHSIIEVLMHQGKKAEASEANAEVLKENPKDADAKSLAATFLLDRGDVGAALAQLQQVVNSSPDNAMAHYQLGRAYLASGKADSRESARQQFELAIAARKDMILPRLGLAELQVMHGEFQAALDSVQQILTRDPGSINARLIQAQALLGEKKFAESDALLTALLKTSPNSPDVLYQSGINALTEGKPEIASAAFMRAYELNPANPKGLLGVVDADIRQNKPEAAMAMLEAESKKAPNRLDLLFLMGTTAEREGKFNDALDYFNKVLAGMDQKATSRADIYLQIANVYRLKGDRDSAVANCLKARDIKPDSEQVLADLGQVLDQAGRKPEARQAYEASLRIGPNNALVLNNLAYLMAETSADLDMALNYAQRAKMIAPNMPDISDTYGWILLKKSLYNQAVPVFKDLVTRYPGQSTYHYHLAMSYIQEGDTAKAIDESKEALKHSPALDEQHQIQALLERLGAK